MGSSPLERALAQWSQGITDPAVKDRTPRALGHKNAITSYFKEGLGWLRWRDELTGQTVTSYGGNLTAKWCGAFAAWCWAPWVPEALRGGGGDPPTGFASTYRLWEVARQDKRWRVPLGGIEPGDILVVGGERGKAWGEHVCLALAAPVGTWVPTVEGNAKGLLHGGAYGEGVVTNLRSLVADYRVRHVYRPPAELRTTPASP